MLHLMRLGPIELDDAPPAFFYLAFGDHGIDSQMASDDVSGLKPLVARSKEPVSCEPELGEVAKKLGLKVEPLSLEAVAMKAGMAIVLSHGTAFESIENPPLFIELADAVAGFHERRTWEAFDEDEALDVVVEKGGRRLEATVMGQAEDQFGLVLFDEPGSLRRSAELAARGTPDDALALPCVTLFTSDKPAYVTEAMEAFTGVAVAPVLFRMKHGDEADVTETDVELIIATLRAVNALAERGELATGTSAFARKKARVTVRRTEPEPESAPDEAELDFEGVGRNDPCPCGSGKKYKQCHLGAEKAASPASPAKSLHELDNRLVGRIMSYATSKLPRQALERAADEAFGKRQPSPGLGPLVLAFEAPIDGAPVARKLLSDPAERLDDAERKWVERELEAHVSVWEVLRVEQGRGFEAIDLLGGVRLFIDEVLASQDLVARDVVLARVVRTETVNLLAGVHESLLPPSLAEGLVRTARAEKLGAGSWKRTVRLLALWDDAVSDHALKLASPTVVKNTDGEKAVFVTDTYAIAKGGYALVVPRLMSLPGAHVDHETKKGVEISFAKEGNAIHAGWKDTVLGAAKVTAKKLEVSANSVERADGLKGRILEVLAGTVSFRDRASEALPPSRGGQELMVDQSRLQGSSGLPELQRSWLDEPIPALGGRTPREAAADEAGRESVHWLLKGLENLEAREPSPMPGGADARRLRRELGLDELGERSTTQELDRAVGSGRKLSETVLEFGEPVLSKIASTPKALEEALRFVTTVWNLTVNEQLKKPEAELAALRAKLSPGKVSAKLLAHFDRLVARKHERYPHDRRLVGEYRLDTSAGQVGIYMETLLTPDLMAKVKAAGILPQQ
ncbi:MAG: SEC-C domain-containing protein [Archangiaceae bacterium]|nr:SEC-C domain-containing protein [Archangiaceae bacterium]